MTIEAGIEQAIQDLEILSRKVGKGTSIGLALTTIKINLQRIQRGVGIGVTGWLVVAEALSTVIEDRHGQ